MMCMVWLLATPCIAVSADDHLVDMKIDDAAKTIVVYMDDRFANQAFTEKSIKKIYKRTSKDVHKALPKQYSTYQVRIMTKGVMLESLLNAEPQEDSRKPEKKKKRHGGWWGDVSYDGSPWVTRVSQPHKITAGLNDRHISLWASHGRYYDVAKGYWKWQRPNMFCTTEDLFTQTIVVPYLIPMLENAGANVFTPRERDWQTQEVIVDNDGSMAYYKEVNRSGRWTTARNKGFAMPDSLLVDSLNPFTLGTVRQTSTTHDADATTATYQPQFSRAGRYAVYVSYATVEKSVDDALYSVYHQGERTDFRVNQRMGGGTWVYLGTFDFDQGCTELNRVVVSAQSREKGVVTTDAVRFGGGMGNIRRGGAVSGLPRCLEGARYYAQWAGAPYEVYGGYKGTDDYKDDINVRSLMTNWIAGGSPYAPTKKGKNVPIDLCLAVHSDAGYNSDMQSVYGSLAVCTTDFNDGKLDAGAARSHSKDLAQMLLDNSKKDLASRYGDWKWRDLYDRNYSETRLPAMPSAIFETLSHQSFPDMKLAHDPDFKFTLARSIYKTILRYEAKAHGTKAVVSPLAPEQFSVMLDKDGNATLRWMPQSDKQEPTADATSYNVYMAMGGLGYDNGVNTTKNSYTIHVEKDMIYRFRVTSVNAGGESFPSEELAVVWHGPEAKTVLIVNGFHRLSSPAVRNSDTEKGFDIDEDPGVSYGLTAGWAGKQQTFSTATAGREGYGTFGYCGNEMAGQFVAGNDFNYVAEHAAAILSAGRYNVVSAARDVVEWGDIKLSDYACVDLLLGNERYDGHSLQTYKTFTKQLQKKLTEYKSRGRGALLVSGSYVASDMMTDEERDFMRNLLGCDYGGTVKIYNNVVTGLQQTLVITNTLNAEHYATTRSDVLMPCGDAFIAMQYGDQQTAAVAVKSAGFPTFTMGFPFECITNSAQRAVTMKGIMAFLVNQ